MPVEAWSSWFFGWTWRPMKAGETTVVWYNWTSNVHCGHVKMMTVKMHFVKEKQFFQIVAIEVTCSDLTFLVDVPHYQSWRHNNSIIWLDVQRPLWTCKNEKSSNTIFSGKNFFLFLTVEAWSALFFGCTWRPMKAGETRVVWYDWTSNVHCGRVKMMTVKMHFVTEKQFFFNSWPLK